MTAVPAEPAAENARLQLELAAQQQRADQAEALLAGSLERERAAAEVLAVIGRHPGDLQPVLDTVVEQAARLSGSELAHFLLLREGRQQVVSRWLRDGLTDDCRLERPHFVRDTFQNTPGPALTAFAEQRSTLLSGGFEAISAQLPQAREVLSVVAAETGLVCGSTAAIPLLHEGSTIGAILLWRVSSEAYTDDQVRLLETFADQAVIAIENARLFNETQQSNAGLRESLERQTATAEVLRIIAGTPTDAQPVFEAIVQSGARLTDADRCAILVPRDKLLEPVAWFGTTDWGTAMPPTSRGLPIDLQSPPARAFIEGRTITIPDAAAADPTMFPGLAQRVAEIGNHSIVLVPLLREGAAIGVLSMIRRGPRPYSDAEIALFETFADQAVIAIENARLFDELAHRNKELAESLEQQTATAEILSVISGAPGNLDASLQAISDAALRLCNAQGARVFLREGDELVATTPSAQAPGIDAGFVPAGTRAPLLEALREGNAVHFPDYLATVEALGGPEAAALIRATGQRSVLLAPMMRGDEPVGMLALARYHEIQPYTEREIALAELFAGQAVVAYENARLLTELEQRNRDLAESLEQQTATAEILRTISDNPGDEQAALQAVADAACRLCHADDGTVWLRAGDTVVAGPTATGKERQGNLPVGESPDPVGAARMLAIIDARRTVHQPDIIARFQALGEHGHAERLRSRGDVAWLNVPLLHGAEGLGLLRLIQRVEQRPFSDAEIALAERFASQAAIALQNARMFVQLQERNREVSAALEQQTATAEVLEAISRSPADVQPVLDTIARIAHRLCGADMTAILLREGDGLRIAATVDLVDDEVGRRVDLNNPRSNPLLCGETLHVADVLAAVPPDHPDRPVYERIGMHCMLAVPLRQAGETSGVIALWRRPAGLFAEPEVTLAETFATQAAIALENTHLFTELQASNARLAGALEQQTAVAGVLQAISRSAFDLQTVLETLNENAARLLHAERCVIFRRHGDELRLMAVRGADTDLELEVQQSRRVVRLDEPDNVALAVLQKRTRRSTIFADNPLLQEAPPQVQRLFAATGTWSHLTAPLLNGNDAIGAIQVAEPSERRFTDAEVRLLQTFADQAVIAMENARLVQDLRDSLERQTAISEVLEIISRRQTDLQEVLDAIAVRAAALTGSDGAVVDLALDGQVYGKWRVAAVLQEGRIDPRMRLTGPTVGNVFRPAPGNQSWAEFLKKRPVHLSGGEAAIEAQYPDRAMLHAYRRSLGYPPVGSSVMVPFLLNDAIYGLLGIERSSLEPYSEAQAALLEVFARQAVVAIENARLLQEIQQKTRELEAVNAELAQATTHKSAFISSMSHELRTPLNAIIGYSEMLAEEAAELGEPSFVTDLGKVNAAGKHLLSLINNILDLSKIEAGKMDCYAEEFAVATVLAEVQAVAGPLVEQQGNRLVVEVADEPGCMHSDLTKVRQCLLNLLSNAAKFTEHGTITLRVAREQQGGQDWLSYAVSDTGIGMTEEQQGRLFQAFSQAEAGTSAKYGGTGLGLALSREFCRMLGGEIGVSSEPGQGSTFTMRLPASAPLLAGSVTTAT